MFIVTHLQHHLPLDPPTTHNSALHNNFPHVITHSSSSSILVMSHLAHHHTLHTSLTSFLITHHHYFHISLVLCSSFHYLSALLYLPLYYFSYHQSIFKSFSFSHHLSEFITISLLIMPHQPACNLPNHHLPYLVITTHSHPPP